jgi:hypothetical protein
MLTVVEEMDPSGPRTWNQAAEKSVSQIFSYASHVRARLDETISKQASEAGMQTDNEIALNGVLDMLTLLDAHFDGMVNSVKVLEEDEIYWANEWRILGCLAAAIGMKMSIFTQPRPLPDSRDYLFYDNQEIPPVELALMISVLLCRKQKDYGKSAISRFGREGLVVRVHDKLARLRNLLLSGSNPHNESLVDTFSDIIGYSAIGIMWERGWFQLPLDRDAVK